MVAWMLLQHGKRLIAQFLVEPWCLKTERTEHHMSTATGTGFLFGGVYELRANTVSS